jgi:hypothetical protein
MNPIERFLWIAAALYFVPTLVAALARKRNAFAIFALNLLLGWTFLGWVLAMVWSVMADPPKVVQPLPTIAVAPQPSPAWAKFIARKIWGSKSAAR